MYTIKNKKLYEMKEVDLDLDLEIAKLKEDIEAKKTVLQTLKELKDLRNDTNII